MGDYSQMFVDMLDGNGFDFEVYPVVDGVFPTGHAAADGWLITGSRHGAYEEHDWIPPLEQLIRDIRDASQPLVGICFGHQIIAQALGGKVEKFGGGWAVGATEYDLGGETITLNAWHQDQVTELPEGAKTVGSNAFCANAVLAYGEQIWTIQPHPEFSGGFIDGLIDTRGRGVVPDALLDAAKDKVHTVPTDTPRIANHIAGVFKRNI